MVLTSNVSPPGRYSVRIVAGSGVEETVTYTITDTDTDGKNAKKYEITNSVPANVPPLEVVVIIGFPRVIESSVEVEFVTTRPVTSATCYLRYEHRRQYRDCMLHHHCMNLIIHRFFLLTRF